MWVFRLDMLAPKNEEPQNPLSPLRGRDGEAREGANQKTSQVLCLRTLEPMER